MLGDYGQPENAHTSHVMSATGTDVIPVASDGVERRGRLRPPREQGRYNMDVFAGLLRPAPPL